MSDVSNVIGRFAPRILTAMRGERGVWPWLLALVATYAVVQAVFILATLIAAAVPNGLVLSALTDGAALRLWQPVDYPADGVGHVTERFPFAGVSDAFTQCIALTMQVPGGDSLWESAMAGRHLGTCSLAIPAVTDLTAGTQPDEVFTYNRYWNGFAVLTRPLLVVGGVGAVRVVVAVLLVVSIVLAVMTLLRRVSRWAPVVLLPVLLSTNILTQPMDAFPHALSFAVILFGVAAGAAVAHQTLPAIFIVAAVMAGIFNFVDFLLNPPVAWALFVFAVVAARWSAGGRTSALWRVGGVAVIGWIAGYGVTWMTRWALAVLTFGKSAWDEILAVVSTRLQGENADLVTPGLLQPTLRNTLFWWGTIPTARVVAVLALVVLVVSIIVMLVRRRGQDLLAMIALAAPAILVPVWLELLNNHSQIHVFFVYRAIPVALGIIAAAALLAATGRRRPVAVERQPSEDRAVSA